MRYVVHCHRCTSSDVTCDELREDMRCPKCEHTPSTYQTAGERFCWLHRERLADTYPVSAFFLTTAHAWRGHSHRFPNAKLFEAGSEGVFAEIAYCQSCQQLYEEYMTQWQAEQAQANSSTAT